MPLSSARFPVAADAVQLSTAAVSGSDQFVGGVRLSADGTLARAAAGPAASWQNGVPQTASGQLVYVDATAGLPAGTQFQNGLPLSPAGEVCVSTDAAAGYLNGLPHVFNGALAAVVNA